MVFVQLFRFHFQERNERTWTVFLFLSAHLFRSFEDDVLKWRHPRSPESGVGCREEDECLHAFNIFYHQIIIHVCQLASRPNLWKLRAEKSINQNCKLTNCFEDILHYFSHHNGCMCSGETKDEYSNKEFNIFLFTPDRVQQELLTKNSYVHIDVSNSSLTELCEVLLEKRQEQGHMSHCT